MKQQIKHPIKQHAHLIIRALKIFAAFPKPLLLSRTLSAIVQPAIPFITIWFSAQILNELAGSRDQNRLAILVLLAIGLNLAAALAGHAAARWSDYCNSQTWLLIFMKYTDKMLSMDYIDIENPDIQQTHSEIRQHHHGMGFGLSKIIGCYGQIIDGIIRVLLSVAFAFTLFTYRVPEGSPFAFLDSPLAVIVMLAILSSSIFLAPYISMIGGRIWAEASHYNNKGNRISGFYYFHMIQDSGPAKDIRIYDQKRMTDQLPLGGFSISGWERFSKYDAKFKALSAGVTHLSNGLIYLFVAMKAFAGAFGVGNILLYVGAITQFGNGFNAVFTHMGELVNNNVHLEKCLQFLDIPNQKYQGTLPVEKRDDNDFTLEFHNVSFKYPGSEAYAIRNLSLKFHIGQRLAVVGMNGSGKTTMIKLLCRLYDPTEGEITLNGIDIKKYNYDEYMDIFGIVFQDFALLPFTLGQNIAASVQYDPKRAVETLEQSGFSDRLAEMPNGLDTYLYKNFEEDGVDISGGEAQKIALSRALYKNTPFIVLDEPTAALDPIAEFEIYSKFNEMVEGKTAVYISHRLASCRFCDDIVVFHEGEIVQRGSHDQLVVDVEGKYYELWNAQAQYYVEDLVSFESQPKAI